MVMFATIFLSTVLRLTNFLSLDSAACSSARNSCAGRDTRQGMRGVSVGRGAHLDLSALEELGIMSSLSTHRRELGGMWEALPPSRRVG